jgi:hypothetical protein
LNIRYIPYSEIDKRKWDDCIKKSANGLIYAESVYLDHMTSNWDAIILNDYEAVMPLTWRKKLFISYLHQPAFIQQGGIFSTVPINDEIINGFVELASSRFRFAELTLNYENKSANHQQVLRNNYILPLGNDYKYIFDNYSKYIKERLKRLEKFDLDYVVSDNYKEVIEIYKELYTNKISSISKADMLNFELLCTHYKSLNRIIVRKVIDKKTNELLAALLMLKDERRIYNLASCVFPKGKKQLANYFLYNNIIKEFCTENIILDFEGSDIPGVAYFYKNLAIENQHYPFIQWNRLPLFLKLLKK